MLTEQLENTPSYMHTDHFQKLTINQLNTLQGISIRKKITFSNHSTIVRC